MRKTIRKVVMVVMLLITSCQVCEKSPTGRKMSQTRTTARARPRAHELPARSVACRAKPSNQPIGRAMFSGDQILWRERNEHDPQFGHIALLTLRMGSCLIATQNSTHNERRAG